MCRHLKFRLAAHFFQRKGRSKRPLPPTSEVRVPTSQAPPPTSELWSRGFDVRRCASVVRCRRFLVDHRSLEVVLPTSGLRWRGPEVRRSGSKVRSRTSEVAGRRLEVGHVLGNRIRVMGIQLLVQREDAVDAADVVGELLGFVAGQGAA